MIKFTVPKVLKLTYLIIFLLVFDFGIIAQENTKNSGRRPTVGLVMSGGGAKGFAYVGVLKVIQEAGLHIDYVAGTSMGSIVAGLYAVGYHPDSIKEMIRAQNWDNVLGDIIERGDIDYAEKDFGGKYIVSLPIKGKKLNMMASLSEGQEVDQLLNLFFSPAYKTNDFSELHVPFLCIGTNIIDGSEVEITDGNLAEAIRASMNIPGYFSPILYNDEYLVDGGIVNNYPVSNLKKKGIDIIIGADVQSGLKDNIEDLSTVTSVIDQITSFYRVGANKEGYANTDIYIPIKMDYGMMDFTSYDSIMAIGENASRPFFDDIKALADSLNAIEYMPVREYKTVPLDSVFVNKVFIEGNDKMPAAYFRDFIDEYENSIISILELKDRITSMYGSRFFKHITYRFKQEKGKNNLYLIVSEADPGYLSAAVHYDLDYQGSILANLTLRNVLGKRSKLFADLILGNNPRFKAFYSLNNASAMGIGAILDMYVFKFNDYVGSLKTGRYTFDNYSLSVFGHKTFKNEFALRAGLKYEYFKFKQDVVTDTSFTKYESFNSYGNLFVSFNIDSYNHSNYPTKGVRAELKAKYVMTWSRKALEDLIQSSAVVYLKYNQSFPLSPKFTLQPGLFAAFTLKQDKLPPIQHWIGVGGLNPRNYVETHISFTGVNFIQNWGLYSWIGKMKLQYRLMNKFYLIGLADVGVNTMDFEELFWEKNIMFGYGLTAAYNSFIGPIEVTAMGSNINPSVSFFVRVGFWL